MISILSIGFFITPSSGSVNQSNSIEFNSMDFNFIDLTNNTCINAFVYSYNISSTLNSSASLMINIYISDGLYKYKFDSLNKTENILANISLANSIQYNFSLSGAYEVQIFWFSAVESILYYKSYTNQNICGLQTNSDANYFSYEYSYFWQVIDNESAYEKLFNLSMVIYFKGEYNFTFDYELKVYSILDNNEEKLSNVVKGSKILSGKGNTVKEIAITSALHEPGNYKAVFSWKDFLVYNKGDIYRSYTIYFGSPNEKIDSNNIEFIKTESYQYYDYQHTTTSPNFGFIIPLGILILGGLFCYKIFFNNKKFFTYQPKYFRPANNNQIVNQNRNQNNFPQQKLSASYCSNCGSFITTSSLYCFNCGSKLD